MFYRKKYNEFNINFHFNRLSIFDLSETANQPMYSKEFKTMLCLMAKFIIMLN